MVSTINAENRFAQPEIHPAMPYLLHHTLFRIANTKPACTLLIDAEGRPATADDFARAVRNLARQLAALGAGIDDRIAVYLPKIPLAVYAYYAASAAAAVFVPINPVLKPAQVRHILNDCAARILITSPERAAYLNEILGECTSLCHLLLSEQPPPTFSCKLPVASWTTSTPGTDEDFELPPRTDNDMAAILYTSGSTGGPKGVIISHRNIVEGARAVSSYLELGPDDRLLALLPFSFDYGLNQLTSAVLAGGTCVLFDYLLPRDVLKALERHAITGLAAVPPLWAQLASLAWPEKVRATLRYITNSGGAMPDSILARLRTNLPHTKPFLMYGLTEAFRSTYLPPDQIDKRRGSIGKAIPNAEILVVRPDGKLADPNEPGELVHRGALVSLGYWNDPARTAVRFKPAPGRPAGMPTAELAVWSGDTVRMDEDGYLYFIGRDDGMIKTSGYRISPEEVEEVVYAHGGIETVAAIGIPHTELGQAIALLVRPVAGTAIDAAEILTACRRALPNYMVPAKIIVTEQILLGPNGKIDRSALMLAYAGLFDTSDTAKQP